MYPFLMNTLLASVMKTKAIPSLDHYLETDI